jgi:hypothetical protein
MSEQAKPRDDLKKITAEKLRQRIEAQTQWLLQSDPFCFQEQKHLDEGCSERIYWHYGYMVALSDLIERIAALEAENARLSALVTDALPEARRMSMTPCCSCHEQTVYSCVFDKMPLCGEIKCREEHEQRGECAAWKGEA